MKKIWLCLVTFAFLLPIPGRAVNLNKSLLDPENWKEKQTFLRGGADFSPSPVNDPPRSIFMHIASSSIKMSASTDKIAYEAGEKVRIFIAAENKGFLFREREGKPTSKAEERFYLWTAGNFFLEIYRLDHKVKDGEFLVASGRAYPIDNISLYQKEKKEFSFDWTIPRNAKSGDYEIRVYPTSRNFLFRGAPEAYRSFLLSRIEVERILGEEDKTNWDLGRITIDGENIRLKEKTVYLKADETHKLAVPLINSGESIEELGVIKQIRGSSPYHNILLSNEEEKIFLSPGEEKVISLEINSAKTKGVAGIRTFMTFVRIEKAENFREDNYADYPVFSYDRESVTVPFYLKGNASFRFSGLGARTGEGIPGFRKGSYFTPFAEVRRTDPLFFYSQGKERSPEDKIKLEITVSDHSGGRVDQFGYEGPSWDRSGLVFKKIQLKKDYDYLKVTGVLSSAGKGEIARDEIEYTPPLTKINLLDRIKGILKNNWVVLTIAGIIVPAILVIMAVVLVVKKKKQNNLTIQQ